MLATNLSGTTAGRVFGLGLLLITAGTASAGAGTIAGSLTYDGPLETGRPGNKALSLDGDGDYVHTSLDDLSGSEITIAFWFKGSRHLSVVRQQILIGSNYVVAGYRGKHILSNDGLLTGIPADNNNGATIEDGNWHHVAMTWKQNTADGFASYLDGELVASRASSNQPIPDHNFDTLIGAATSNGVSPEFTLGLVDDVAIWNRALDLAEIREAMNAPLQGNEAGLLGYWNFDDGTADDLTVAANHGVLVGDATIVDAEDLGGSEKLVLEASPDSPDNQVLCLDGLNDFVEVSSLKDLSGSELTISYWFKGSTHLSIVRQQTFGNNYIVAGYGPQHILSNDGLLSGVAADNSGGATIQDGEWHHVVMSWKQNTTDGFASYLDGMPVASRNSTNTPIPDHNRSIYFGSSGGSSEFANGCIDEIAIWNRALSAAEVAGGWNQRLAGDESGLVGYWTFDDGTAADATSNNHDGTLRNGAAIMSETIPPLDGLPLRQVAFGPGAYLLEGATEGVDYYVDAYYDTNGNGTRDADEWRASFQGNPFAITGDVTGVDLTLYDPETVWLQIVPAGGDLELRWPEFATGISLTTSADLEASVWNEFPGPVSTDGGVRSAEVTPSVGPEFFRLEDERR